MSHPYTDKIEIGDATLYCGDCLDILPTLDKVDCVIADYPFNCQDGRDDYVKFVEETARQFDAISAEVCNMVVINNPANIFKTAHFYYKWTLINGIALIRKGSLRPAWHFGFQHNYALILNKGGIKNKWNGTRVNHDKEFDTDVIEYQNGYRGKGKAWHPQAIPLDLTKKFVEYLSDESDTILDPFMGSGTTGVAALKFGRKFIGIEFSEKYFDIAVNRISTEANQLKLSY